MPDQHAAIVDVSASGNEPAGGAVSPSVSLGPLQTGMCASQISYIHINGEQLLKNYFQA